MTICKTERELAVAGMTADITNVYFSCNLYRVISVHSLVT